MSLQSYANNARAISDELKDILLDEEYDELLEAIPDDWQERILAIRDAHEPHVIAIVTATPAKRQKLLMKYSIETRFWLIAAAVQMARDAFYILNFATSHLHPGGPYRDMIATVQEMLNTPYVSIQHQWPFPSYLPPRE